MAYEPVTTAEYRAHVGRERPGTRALRDANALALVTLTGAGPAKRGEIVSVRPVRGGTEPSTHSVGRGVDTYPLTKLAGDILFLRSIRAAHALGVCECIWWRKRWTAERGIQRYNGVNPHTDHLHESQTRAAADNPADHATLVRWQYAALTAA